jgi:cytochrome c oxidase subunit 3
MLPAVAPRTLRTPISFVLCSAVNDAKPNRPIDAITMAMAVNMGYRKDRKKTFWLMAATALLGASFVGMQAFEWTKLIVDEGVRPWSNPMGAAQFGASFFMITGFHGLHVSAGVIYLMVVANRVRNGFYEKRGGNYEIVEIAGLYWHFVDLVWVFIFAFFYLW